VGGGGGSLGKEGYVVTRPSPVRGAGGFFLRSWRTLSVVTHTEVQNFDDRLKLGLEGSGS